MADGRVVFLHGRESGPGGTKATWLAERLGAITPQMDTTSVAAALPTAREALRAHAPPLVVGSSFGGAVTVALLQEGVIRVPVVLLAPAVRRLGVPNLLPEGTRAVILHGENDDLVPLEDSRALAATGGAGVSLRVIAGPDGDHRLNALLADGTLAGVLDALLQA
jgi:pimeloyl-ACP methyl ester carboxylesterase